MINELNFTELIRIPDVGVSQDKQKKAKSPVQDSSKYLDKQDDND